MVESFTSLGCTFSSRGTDMAAVLDHLRDHFELTGDGTNHLRARVRPIRVGELTMCVLYEDFPLVIALGVDRAPQIVALPAFGDDVFRFGLSVFAEEAFSVAIWEALEEALEALRALEDSRDFRRWALWGSTLRTAETN